jgi:hypothetical protein
MPLNPEVSFTSQDAAVDSSFTKTMVIVGQTKTTTVGLIKDIELKSQKEINILFGEDSHLAANIRDVLTMFSNTIVKPKIWAISFIDDEAAVERVLDSTVTGTATEDKTLKIRLNSLNPDRTSAQAAAVLALRNTKGAFCGDYARNAIEFGAPVNARRSYNPILAKAFTNDVIVEVEITNGMTNSQVATAINDAINAKTSAIYGSSVLSNVVTLTANHKGSLSNLFGFEILQDSIADGISISTVETTPGSGVVDITGILDIVDNQGNRLGDLNFNYVSLPLSYSATELVNDGYSKAENVLNYNNQCLEYNIFRGTALDLSDDVALNALAVAEPVEEKGLVKTIFVSELDGLRIRGTWDKTTRNKIEAKQFSPIQRELDGRISVGNTYTLSSSIGFVNIERTLASFLIREILVEKFIPDDFGESDFTTGISTDSSTYNRNEVIALFQYYRDILDGTVINSIYGNDFSGLVSNSDEARSQLDELLDATVTFNSVSKQLALKYISELINPIKSIFIISSYL